jgi:hypothetical protein
MTNLLLMSYCAIETVRHTHACNTHLRILVFIGPMNESTACSSFQSIRLLLPLSFA